MASVSSGSVYSTRPFCVTTACAPGADSASTRKMQIAAAQIPAIPTKYGDASYQIEVLPGYEVRLIVWEGDDEFPPNAQILFSDNFPQAFSAEDRTVTGDLVITEFKRRM